MATKKLKVKFEWIDMGDRIYLKVNGKQPPILYIVAESRSDGTKRAYLNSNLFHVPCFGRNDDTVEKVKKKAEAIARDIAALFTE